MNTRPWPTGGGATTRRLLSITLVLFGVTLVDTITRRTVLPQYLLQLTCDSPRENPDGKTCDSESVVDKADDWLELASMSANGAALSTVSLSGYLADAPVIGRRATMMGVVVLAMLLDNLAIASAPSLNILVVVHAACNLFGNSYTALVFGFSMVADATAQHSREKHFNLTEGGLYVGIVVGPFVGGALERALGFRPTFLFVAAVLLVLLIYCRRYLHADDISSSSSRTGKGDDSETLLTARVLLRRRGRRKRCRAAEVLPLLGAARFFNRTRRRLLLATALSSEWLGRRGSEFIIPLVGKQVFDWGTFSIGIVNGGIGALGVVSNVLLFRALRDGCGLGSAAIVAVTSAATVAACAMWVLSNSDHPALFVAGGAVYGIGGLISPTLRGMLSRCTASGEQAVALGSAAALELLAGFVAPPLFAQAFHFCDERLGGEAGAPQLAFALGALCVVVTVAVALFGLRGGDDDGGNCVYADDNDEEEEEEEEEEELADPLIG